MDVNIKMSKNKATSIINTPNEQTTIQGKKTKEKENFLSEKNMVKIERRQLRLWDKKV